MRGWGRLGRRSTAPNGDPIDVEPDLRRLHAWRALGVAAASIWAGWIVIARLGLKTGLTPWDIAALRFGVGGL